VVSVVVLLLLAGGGYAAYAGLSGGSPTPKAAPIVRRTCPVASVPGPSDPHDVHLVVLNATLTSGLAAQVSAQLKHRGFHVSSIGNTAKLGSGVATVRYGAGRQLAAQAVADQIGSAVLVRGGHGIELDVGPGFHRLATVAQARAAALRFVAQQAAAKAAAASASPSPSASPTCIPRS
jgi:LytR cell envelope-related transcriptional attenuator